VSLPLPNTPFDPALSVGLQLGLILLATLASEDLTCIWVGLLVRAGRLDLAVGLAGCFVGIFVGDLGLWLVGRVGAVEVVRLPWAGPRLGRLLAGARNHSQGRLDPRAGWAVMAARFLPGARLPLYLAAGALGGNLGRFTLWTALACLVWTPVVVLAAALLGEGVVGSFALVLGRGWPAWLLSGVALVLGLRVLPGCFTPGGRGRLLAVLALPWRREFWPAWLFYLPLLPWLAWLSLRHRGALAWTAANPGIPHGGVVGESKFAILEQLPPQAVVPSLLAPPGPLCRRLEQVRGALTEKGWAFPLVLKPDAGQRGAGVKRAKDFQDVERYLSAQPEAVLVQPWHPGPYEAGVFYYRLPGDEAGRIFSVTDKVFPVLVGDGKSTLEELIWRHPRFRMQAGVFLTRHAAARGRILAAGEHLPLALAGNHCQGTMFRDGAHLITSDLERAIDSIARSFPGFFIGRFDIRYSSPEDFAAGRRLAVVELNGATSESTNIYDPSWSLLAAYRTLFRQWALLYRIGSANRRLGRPATSLPSLLRLIRDHQGPRSVSLLAD
jgi:membrane protein DedA with SNARE-associated domain